MIWKKEQDRLKGMLSWAWDDNGTPDMDIVVSIIIHENHGYLLCASASGALEQMITEVGEMVHNTKGQRHGCHSM